MSYRPVVVALRRDTQVTLEEQLERVMAPFMPDPDDPRKPSHCDGWRIGGQWTGHFLSRSGDRTNLVHSYEFPAESPLSEYVACDGGPKGALDLEYLQRTAEEKVWRRWPSRFAQLFGLRDPWARMPAQPSEEEVKAIVKGNPDLLAQARGQAVTLEGLVTLVGEWIDPGLTDHERGPAFTRADACIDAMDDDAWLVCLSVHF